ncbi:lipopolysaccharide biosynthesis protein [Rhodococcus sp. 24CO]|uniref:lipopolysaccharide biosynthesis protein n=1 Tax=Rhodococcus sp. 24CO TaxID=3117460 RepID=UPI003D3266FA
MTAPSGDTVISPGAAIAGDPSMEGPSTGGSSTNGHSLERNSLALTVSALLTGVVGLVYWAILGRLYPAREVGAAAAVITTATMLSAFGNFGIGGLFERFLPLAGQRSKSMVGAGFAVGAVGGLLLGGGFLLLGPTSEMFLHPFEYWLFPVVVVVFSTFAMLDHTAVAFREAGWAAGKNVAHAIVKLVLAAALAFTASHLAIIWTWTIPALIAALVLGVMVARRLRTPDHQSAPSQLPPRREIGNYLAGSYGIYVVSALAPLLLPLIVVSRMGADANAYFAISWSLVTAVLVLMTMLMGPYVAASASSDPTRLYGLTLRFFAILGAVALSGVLLFAVIAPVMLEIVGKPYAEQGTPLLRLAAIALIPATVVAAYTAVARVRRRLRLAVAVQICNAALILGLSLALIDEHGLVALGWAYIVAESVSAVILVVPLTRAVLAMRSESQSVN